MKKDYEIVENGNEITIKINNTNIVLLINKNEKAIYLLKYNKNIGEYEEYEVFYL